MCHVVLINTFVHLRPAINDTKHWVNYYWKIKVHVDRGRRKPCKVFWLDIGLAIFNQNQKQHLNRNSIQRGFCISGDLLFNPFSFFLRVRYNFAKNVQIVRVERIKGVGLGGNNAHIWAEVLKGDTPGDKVTIGVTGWQVLWHCEALLPESQVKPEIVGSSATALDIWMQFMVWLHRFCFEKKKIRWNCFVVITIMLISVSVVSVNVLPLKSTFIVAVLYLRPQYILPGPPIPYLEFRRTLEPV